jgi:hypothetical protein
MATLTEKGGIGRPKTSSFVFAAVLLLVLAAGALWAEAGNRTSATTQLWTAFQTILGVIVGFLSGEATGAASKK